MHTAVVIRPAVMKATEKVAEVMKCGVCLLHLPDNYRPPWWPNVSLKTNRADVSVEPVVGSCHGFYERSKFHTASLRNGS